ncbi:hypothetical protein [Aquimarina macrocephali]|uniref:hypothetical protein n=1 Tax=Aquimarina macrocephali TaxID=666563 RepID=UPI000465E10D|nr:hypothetical protein [Aquimarina macrocephali]
MKKQAKNSKKLNLKKLEIAKLYGLNTIYGGQPHNGQTDNEAPTSGDEPIKSCRCSNICE